MIFTTTVVNAHALSHLFDNDLNSIEVCDTCDECTISTSEVYILPATVTTVQTSHFITCQKHSTFNLTPAPELNSNFGQYFNKPPPFKLV